MRLAPEDQYPNDPEQQRRSNIERDKVGSVGCYGEMQALQSHNVAWSGLPESTLGGRESTSGLQDPVVGWDAGDKTRQQQERKHNPTSSSQGKPPQGDIPIGLAGGSCKGL